MPKRCMSLSFPFVERTTNEERVENERTNDGPRAGEGWCQVGRMKGYGFQIETKYTAHKLGFKITEVPVIFVNRQLGTSKMSSSIFGEAFWGVIKLRFRNFKKR